jgi:hypothetical protein
MKSERRMKSSWGQGQAIRHTPTFSDITREYRKLNSREARVAFVDTFLKTWASHFEESWPVIYQALEWVEQDKLYQDPRAVDPTEVYPDFKAYFEARMRRPFTLWIELEQTHRYVTNFAPELIEQTWSEVRSWVQRFAADPATQPLGNVGRPPKTTERKGNDVTISAKGNSAAYLVRRLKRDAPEIAAALGRGEYPSARAAAKAAGIIRDPTPLERLQRLWPNCTAAEQAEFLAWIDDPQRVIRLRRRG